MPIPKSTLDLLITAIREEGSYVLASLDDAEFFRKSFRPQKPPAPKPVEIPPAKPIFIKEEKKKEPPLVASPPKIETPLPISTVNFNSVRNVLSVVAPELAVISDIPSDTIAKSLSQRWKTKNQTAPISILSYQEPPEQRALLEEIAKAIDIYYGPAKIVQAEKIEKDKQWEAFLSVENLKLVIACDYTLWQLSHLMHFYKETPAQNARVLGNIPLFLLPDLSLYLKDALLKRSLWKALCQKCS